MVQIRVKRGAAYEAHEKTREAIVNGGFAVRKVSSTKIQVLESEKALADKAWAKLAAQVKKT